VFEEPDLAAGVYLLDIREGAMGVLDLGSAPRGGVDQLSVEVVCNTGCAVARAYREREQSPGAPRGGELELYEHVLLTSMSLGVPNGQGRGMEKGEGIGWPTGCWTGRRLSTFVFSQLGRVFYYTVV
jgi:hypothetical protein